MATGFLNKYANGEDGFLNQVGSMIKNLSNLGFKYDDLVVKQSRAVGATEAQFSMDGPMPEDMAYTLSMADIGQKKYTAFFDKDYQSRREFLRKFSMNGEIEWILDTICDDAIVYDNQNFFAYPDLSNLGSHLKEETQKEVIEKAQQRYKEIYNHFHFNDDVSAWQYFRQLMIDGFLAFEIIYDEEWKNIIGFKELDPISLRPQKEETEGGYKSVWMQYEDSPNLARPPLYDAQIIYISYAKGNIMMRVSYLERLVRSLNLLRLMENTRLIWNLMNSTFRMKMVIPIGTKSPQKAKESLNELMALYKEDIYLDFDSGELLINGKPSMQFYKNYLFPSKNGEQPEIETIAGEGPDLNDTDSLKYFWDKLKKDSKVPESRFDGEGGGGQMMIGSDGLDREEIRFSKFIGRLRSTFQEVLWKPLYLQLCIDFDFLKDDEQFRSNLGIKFQDDNIYKKLKEMEFLQRELDFVGSMGDLMDDADENPIIPREWAAKQYLSLTDDQWADMKQYKKDHPIGDGDDF